MTTIKPFSNVQLHTQLHTVVVPLMQLAVISSCILKWRVEILPIKLHSFCPASIKTSFASVIFISFFFRSFGILASLFFAYHPKRSTDLVPNVPKFFQPLQVLQDSIRSLTVIWVLCDINNQSGNQYCQMNR